jgi:hypothetical protein
VAAVPGLKLLLRSAPFLVGVLAAAVWLRRNAQAERPQLPAPRPEPAEPRSRRFERRPIDIVTVVDDLLDVGRL